MIIYIYSYYIYISNKILIKSFEKSQIHPKKKIIFILICFIFLLFVYEYKNIKTNTVLLKFYYILNSITLDLFS